MNFKPGDFLLGIIDILAILLPGIITVALNEDRLLNLIELNIGE